MRWAGVVVARMRPGGSQGTGGYGRLALGLGLLASLAACRAGGPAGDGGRPANPSGSAALASPTQPPAHPQAAVAQATRLAATAGAPPPTLAPERRLGGLTSIAAAGRDAFGQPAANLLPEDKPRFTLGKSFFNDNWVTAPASTAGRDGLGPSFNAQACASCHPRDGRGGLPDAAAPLRPGLVLRLGLPGLDARGRPLPLPGYGGQLQDRAILGVAAEGRIAIDLDERPGAYADGGAFSLAHPRYRVVDPAFGPLPASAALSPRLAPPLVGLGLLEAVDEAALLALSDPEDRDGDGISGRPNRAWDQEAAAFRLGRFGWKAGQPSLRQQTATAFLEDIGITSPVLAEPNCPPEQAACRAAPDGGRPELDEAKLGQVTFYLQTLAVPAARPPADPRGGRLFDALGCAACHRPTLPTGSGHPVAALRGQTIRPYTDLLLHDLGPDLADGLPEGAAAGAEWRTAPLWGLGLTREVSGHERLLHDGRARGVAEAILWHGGEAAAAREAFRRLGADERAALLAFLAGL